MSAEAEKEAVKDLEAAGAAGPEAGAQAAATPPKHKWTPFDPLHRHPPSPPYASLDDAPEIPLATANILSRLGFFWIEPILVKGYKRTLVAEDLWKMDPSREAGLLADQFELHFERRRKDVEDWNRKLDEGFKPSAVRKMWVGIALALSDTFRWLIWFTGFYKVFGDLAQVCAPLITKQIIYFVANSVAARDGVAGVRLPKIGEGVGYAVALFLLQMIFSICSAQVLSRSAQVGILVRGALIAAVYRRAMILSNKSRVKLSNAKLISYVSADISRIDFGSGFFHFTWGCAVQLIVVIIILLVELGVSILTGIALIAIIMPLQIIALKYLSKTRTKSMRFTDARIRLINELLMGIRVIKQFAWEHPYLAKVHELRNRELAGIRLLLGFRSALQAVSLSIPVLASIIILAVYSALGGTQSPAKIWTSISLLNLLRIRPLMMLPQSLSTSIDAKNALDRLVDVFTCETLEEHFLVDPEAKDAIVIDKANFTWESATPPDAGKKKGKKAEAAAKVDDVAAAPSRLEDISLSVPEGELWIVCGPVGSGKSSLLQGMVGEMRRVSGNITYSGSVSYCAQQPWTMNTTLRENILFGRPFDEARYWDCVRAACLLPDLAILPEGDMTEIGEKGIALSGGQRQRVSICRTLYYNADVVLLDDILSALDAHVGASIFKDVIMGALANKTRILATHAIHLMPAANRILCLENGKIVEQGTYAELVAANGTFARLAAEYGRAEAEKEKEEKEKLERERLEKMGSEEKVESGASSTTDETAVKEEAVVLTRKKKESGQMQKEEQGQGSISGAVWRVYFLAGHGWINGPLLLFTLIMFQAGNVVGQLELTWWQQDKFHKGEGFYLGIYAMLGVLSALFTFFVGIVTVRFGTTASATLHHDSIDRVLAAPISLFDTTPIGRILNRFTKDIDSIDNRLNDTLRFTLITMAQIVGTIVLIAIVDQWFLIAVFALMFGYYYLGNFYRESAREIKRIDNVLRSALYAHFSESLSGLATVRAFGETPRFIKANASYLDLENRAYFLTVINQRWLGERLDFLSSILVFVLAIICVVKRFSISSSDTGLILSAILTIQQTMSTGVRMFAEVENNLASVERLHHYAANIEQEKPAEIEETKPGPSWPAGGIEFKDVVMSYRPDLPAVLHGLSVKINPGEKVGIVGRTGAGKSTILQCLFRIVELTSGSISIDGVDISTLGLKDLRMKLSVIPQDSILFNGTLRSNLDPFGDYDDATLWSALKRAWLVERETGEGGGQVSRFTLDTVVEDEGLNMSVGERSLVSLARALVKDSQIVVLDEATANVDMESDARIQRTITSEFRNKTLLCIAHRLNTIIGYDRIVVMDKGRVAAFDTPANLFSREEGIFHSLCVQSGITLETIEAARKAMSA
ncbi:ABC transporter [Pseudohyphozyma bogoriensis]|nr:ABC transporter [Pseudohyphozyma bogoriensis]